MFLLHSHGKWFLYIYFQNTVIKAIDCYFDLISCTFHSFYDWIIYVNDQANEIESLKRRLTESEEKASKLIGKMVSSLGEGGHQPLTSCLAQTQVDGGLFQDMMENFKNLLESHLQCSVCSEVYTFSVTMAT